MALREAYPLRLLCRLLEVPRGTLYHRPKGQRGEEGALRVRLRTLAGTWPRYGYRRLGVLLREEGLLLPRPHPKPKTSSSGVLPLGEGGNRGRGRTLGSSARSSPGGGGEPARGA